MKRIILSTFRNYKRKPVTSFINLFGLSLSLSLVIILSVYCYSELSTDSHQQHAKQIYLVCNEKEITTYGSISPGILKRELDFQVPSIKSSVRITHAWKTPVFKVENNEPINSELIFADSTFFKIFTYLPVSGSIENALKEPMSLVLTKSEAKKLFGKEQVVGKTVVLNNSHLLTVTAVIEEPKENSCLSIKAIVSLSSMLTMQGNEDDFTNWWQRNFLTFVQIDNRNKVIETETTIDKLFPQDIRMNWKTKLIPFRDIYFSKNGITSFIYYMRVGDKIRVMILLMVAVLILIIALINYISITSAEWLERQKQKGIQKVLGASRFNIFTDIIIGSSLTFLIAILLAGEFVGIVSHFIRNATGIGFNRGLLISPIYIVLSFISAVFLGGLSSLFLALKISSTSLINSLKNNVSTVRNKLQVRTIFVVFQFATAICLIAFTLLIQKQIKFASANLGFDKENIVAIKITDQLEGKKEVLKKLLLEQPNVVKVSYSQFYPINFRPNIWSTLTYQGEERKVNFGSFFADANFLELLGIKLINGRLFSNDLITDKGKVLVNETFIKKSGIRNPIGASFGNQGNKYEIIGVIKDFHFKPVYEQITPLAIICGEPKSSFAKAYFLIKIKSNNSNILQSFIESTNKICNSLSPNYPIEISFMNAAIEDMYQSEIKFRRTFSLFSGSALFICCLGILAFSLFSCQRRTKEIGIRKVFGAKVSDIIPLLNLNFLKWITIAFVIACPVAWYIMNRWLENFAYKTTINWWIFALSGIVAVGITLMTVLLQTLNVAYKNPVEALRYE